MSNHDSDGDCQTVVAHCQHDEIDVYIGRGKDGRSMRDTPIGERGWLGNPFTLDDYSRKESIARFCVAFEARLEANPAFRKAVANLSGKTLGCWCQRADEESPSCHGEVIAHYADKLTA